MKSILLILATALASTSTMTLFSYVVAEIFRKSYKEPVLLEHAASSLRIEMAEDVKPIASWILHYSIGLVFVVVFHLLWILDSFDLSVATGIIVGSLLGIVGILGWDFIFKFSRLQHTEKTGYYIQLFFAHIVFGITMVGLYRFADLE